MSTKPQPQTTINLRPSQAVATLFSMLLLSILFVGFGVQGIADAYQTETVSQAIGATIQAVIALAIGLPLLGWFVYIIRDLINRGQ